MAIFSLRIYRRRAPQETAGILAKKVDIEANSPDAAIIEASVHLEGLDWTTYFAGLDDDRFVKFWVNEQS